MIDHITIRVGDIAKTISFYEKALKPLGYSLSFNQTFGGGVRVVGFGRDGKIDTWFTSDKPASGPVHVSWKAGSKEEVDVFYKEALSAGGTDNGAPGTRTEYHENYYGAFILDPGGNNIEAVFGN